MLIKISAQNKLPNIALTFVIKQNYNNIYDTPNQDFSQPLKNAIILQTFFRFKDLL